MTDEPVSDGRSAAVDAGVAAGSMLGMIRGLGPLTRADLIRSTGLGRSTVAQRVDALIDADSSWPRGEARPPAGGER